MPCSDPAVPLQVGLRQRGRCYWGMTVEIPYPIRDAYSDLSISTSGRIHLNGDQLLAAVRTRQADQLIHGQWVHETEAQGASAHGAGVVFGALSASPADGAAT